LAGLKIKDETVFVIYRNGEPYKKPGRKLVYTTKGAANGIITTDTYEEAYQKYKGNRKENGYTMSEWYYLSSGVQEKLIDEIKRQFEIIEYGPKGR
jgi:hypothetical protein